MSTATTTTGAKGRRSKAAKAQTPPVGVAPPVAKGDAITSATLPLCPSEPLLGVVAPRAGLRVTAAQWDLYSAVMTDDRFDERFTEVGGAVSVFRQRIAATAEGQPTVAIELPPAVWQAVLLFTCTVRSNELSDLRMAIIPVLQRWEYFAAESAPRLLPRPVALPE